MKQLILALFLLVNFSLVAQEDAYLYNPSFEGIPKPGQVPEAWVNCDRFGETPPDTHPSGAFGITKSAYEGRTYLGMVTRDNDTWESIGQELKQPLQAGKTYVFKAQLARSDRYISHSRLTGQQANYTIPARLKIWGGNNKLDIKQLFGETALVGSQKWEEHIITFTAEESYNFFLLEVFYESLESEAYCGHVLIDNASITLEEDAPFSGEEKLDETVSLEVLNNRIKELECNANVTEDNQMLFVKPTLISNVITFYELSQEMGLLPYVQSRSVDNLTAMIRNLEGVGAKQRADQLKEVIRLNMKSREGDLSKEEVELLKLYEDVKTQPVAKDDIPQLVNQFIELHKAELIEAVNACEDNFYFLRD